MLQPGRLFGWTLFWVIIMGYIHAVRKVIYLGEMNIVSGIVLAALLGGFVIFWSDTILGFGFFSAVEFIQHKASRWRR